MPKITSPDKPKVYDIHLYPPHDKQERIINSEAKRKVIRAGRRGGKTLGAATAAMIGFAEGKRVLYAAPTTEQLDAFWNEVKRAMAEPLSNGVYHKNETLHIVELLGSSQRIKAKTAWNADTLRGDFADLLILDEYQLMCEDAWELVGAPMLLDNDGDAWFIYTPLSPASKGISKARDPLHAAKLYKKALNDPERRWQAFHFRSQDNPYISPEALEEISKDMSSVSYRLEILAEDDEEAVWKGLIYKPFRQDHIVPRRPIPDSWPVYVGHDFGIANPAAMFFAQDPDTGYFYAFREYLPGPGGSVASHTEKFLEITAGKTVIKRAGGAPSEEEVRQAYSDHGWIIDKPKIKEVKLGIDRVYALHELGKVFVFEDLYNYIYQKRNYSWKLNPDGSVSDDIQDKAKFHLMDAERYILSDFTPETAKSGEAVTVIDER